MADKEEAPAPVAVKASVPLEVKIIKESIDALGGSTESALTKSLADANSIPTPVIIAAVQNPVPTTMENTAENPINVTTDKAIPVIVQGSSATPPRPDVTKGEGATLAPTTTEQDDVVTSSQRHINRVWEYSQSVIAISITAAIIYCAVNKITSQDLANAFFLIVGFYFSRTNHERIGGVGKRPSNESYTGRIILF